MFYSTRLVGFRVVTWSSIPFYEKLGLQLIVDALPHYARFVCSDGESALENLK
ncbi:MAG TPA: hypothetical protein VJ953_07625 [Saprospiraceae bacterium]|nr:hypothetical protein [Saprospiraceae bacterium]